jgi:hypothetical protein
LNSSANSSLTLTFHQVLSPERRDSDVEQLDWEALEGVGRRPFRLIVISAERDNMLSIASDSYVSVK